MLTIFHASNYPIFSSALIQVINAAQLVAANPTSAEARANLEAFKGAWLRSLAGVTKAVDDVTNIVDFLAVTEAHILDDIKKCVLALQDRDGEDVWINGWMNGLRLVCKCGF